MNSPVFDIVGVKKDDAGNYIALIDKHGAEISFKGTDGKPIFLNKDVVDKFLNKKGEQNELV